MQNNYTLFQQLISTNRLQKYADVTNSNVPQTIALYEANLTLSTNLYALIAILEVCLRNSLNDTLSTYFNNRYWIDTERNGFMLSASLAPFRLKSQADAAVLNLQQRGMNVRTHLITELTFSFWVRLFQSDYFAVLRAKPMDIFRYGPRLSRHIVHQKLKHILEIRNRIAHHEAICFGRDVRSGNNIIDLTRSKECYDSIYDLLFWLGGNDLMNWVQLQIDKQTIIQTAQDINLLIHQQVPALRRHIVW